MRLTQTRLLLICAVLIGCGNEDGDPASAVEDLEDSVTLTLWETPPPALDAEQLIFTGSYNTSLPLDNPAPALGTNHLTDPDAQRRLDDYAAATLNATELRIHRGSAPTDGALLVVSGCKPNPVILDELERLGSELCAPDALGQSITFANVQLARVAPNGPYHIYDDYAVQTLPLFLDTGGCLTGAWLCEDDTFSGVFVPSYRSQADIFTVASATDTTGPGDPYGDATYADLRLGGVEVIVRHLIDVDPIAAP
ncbi:MAG: hypothetical protein AAFU77_14480 [Myxococcota bacterium]